MNLAGRQDDTDFAIVPYRGRLCASARRSHHAIPVGRQGDVHARLPDGAADFFTCGDTVNPWVSFDYLKDYLKAKQFNCVELARGSTQLINEPKFLSNGVVQTAVRVAGGEKMDTQIANEVIQMQVPEGYSAITAHELNENLNQHVTTIAKVIEAK